MEKSLKKSITEYKETENNKQRIIRMNRRGS